MCQIYLFSIIGEAKLKFLIERHNMFMAFRFFRDQITADMVPAKYRIKKLYIIYAGETLYCTVYYVCSLRGSIVSMQLGFALCAHATHTFARL